MITLIFLIALVGFTFQLMTDPREEMIFSFYGRFLIKLSKRNKLWFHITKPLGLCIVCNTVWIGLLLTLFFFNESIILSLILSISAAGVANIIQLTYIFIKKHL
jgi:hypothetical protein